MSRKTIEFFDRVVPLSDVKLGIVIASCDLSCKTDTTKYTYYHLVGFTRNSHNELVLALQRFSDNDNEVSRKVYFIHPGNCCIEDY